MNKRFLEIDSLFFKIKKIEISFDEIWLNSKSKIHLDFESAIGLNDEIMGNGRCLVIFRHAKWQSIAAGFRCRVAN